jgi:PERQ amino acid-rich with GYF domain-containing protein
VSFSTDNLGDNNNKTPRSTDLQPLKYGHYDFSGQPFRNVQDRHFSSPSFDLKGGAPRPADAYGFHNLIADSASSQSPQNTSPELSARSPWKLLPDPSINQRSTTMDALQPPLANRDAQPAASTSQHSPWDRVGQKQKPTFIPQMHELAANTTSEKASPPLSGPPAPVSIATGSLSQHNQLEEVSRVLHELPLGSLEQKKHALPAAESPPTEHSPTQPPSRTSLNRQSSPEQATPGNSAAVPVAQKMAWVKEEEGKRKKGSIPSLNIREIQEAEVKKLESRKAAEREKVRLARSANAIDIKEDHQPFTTSWGLPTSQAGTRINVAAKEPLAATAQTPPTTHVWTTTPLKQAIVKKTMKEIQEEEETRKRLLAKETSSLTVPKRAYAETTTRAAGTPIATSSNNAWTTVGPSGKTSAVLASTLRPSVPTSSGSGTLAVPRVSSSPVQKATSPPTLKSRSVSNKADDLNETPSHDFLKWLSDSLKGLNSSVNGE